MKLGITLVLSLLLISCSGTQSNQYKDNSELVVTYYGKEVHRRSSIYSSMSELTELLHSSKRKYIIFGAPSCPPCKTLIRALEQSGHKDMVVFLNLEEEWVVRLHSIANLKSIPSMIVADSFGKPEKILNGTSDIVMYLLINVPTE